MRPLKKKKLNDYNSTEEEEDKNSSISLSHNLYDYLYAKKENVSLTQV